MSENAYSLLRPTTEFDGQVVNDAVVLYAGEPLPADSKVMAYMFMLCDKAKSVIEDRPKRDLPGGVAISSVPADVAILIEAFDTLGCKDRGFDRPPSSFDSIVVFMQWHVMNAFHSIAQSIHSKLQDKWTETGSWDS